VRPTDFFVGAGFIAAGKEETFAIPGGGGVQRDALSDCGLFGGWRDRFGDGSFEFGGGCGEGEVRRADQGDLVEGQADGFSGIGDEASPSCDESA
jgi:hypothetical protein